MLTYVYIYLLINLILINNRFTMRGYLNEVPFANNPLILTLESVGKSRSKSGNIPIQFTSDNRRRICKLL